MKGWIAARPAQRLFTAALCQAEIRAGLAILLEGRRRTSLEKTAQAMFEEDFEGRTRTFDSHAAAACAEIVALDRRSGRPIAAIDLAIPAIARSRRATHVTRTAPDFLGCGVAVVDPWTAT